MYSKSAFSARESNRVNGQANHGSLDRLQHPPKGPEKAVVKGKNYSFPAALDSNPNPYVSTEVKLTKKNDQTGLATFGTPNADFSKTKSGFWGLVCQTNGFQTLD